MRLNQSTCQSAKYRRSSFDHLTAGSSGIAESLGHWQVVRSHGASPLPPGKAGRCPRQRKGQGCAWIPKLVTLRGHRFLWLPGGVYKSAYRVRPSWMHPGCFPANLQPYAGKKQTGTSFAGYLRLASPGTGGAGPGALPGRRSPRRSLPPGGDFGREVPGPAPPARQRDASAPRHTGVIACSRSTGAFWWARGRDRRVDSTAYRSVSCQPQASSSWESRAFVS